MTRGTGHYGGASMAIPMAIVVVVLAMAAPWLLVSLVLVSLTLVGIAAIVRPHP